MGWRGPWGTNKSMQHMYENVRIKLVYLDAWQNIWGNKMPKQIKKRPSPKKKNCGTLTMKWKEFSTMLCLVHHINAALSEMPPSSLLEKPHWFGYAHTHSHNNALGSLVPPPARTVHTHPSPNDVLCSTRTHWTSLCIRAPRISVWKIVYVSLLYTVIRHYSESDQI